MRKQESFTFEAAHTLERALHTGASRRIHGHSYRAAVALRGTADPHTGMLVDLGAFDQLLTETKNLLDHRFLDDIPDLGSATMENLAAWIWRRMAPLASGLFKVMVYRDSQGDACTYYGPAATP